MKVKRGNLRHVACTTSTIINLCRVLLRRFAITCHAGTRLSKVMGYLACTIAWQFCPSLRCHCSIFLQGGIWILGIIGPSLWFVAFNLGLAVFLYVCMFSDPPKLEASGPALVKPWLCLLHDSVHQHLPFRCCIWF